MMKEKDSQDRVVNLKSATIGDVPTRRKGIYLLPNLLFLVGSMRFCLVLAANMNGLLWLFLSL
jgi:hypothetical protein